jgi:predicted TIM-barrel fold metal-dependent hydrolase
LAALDARAAVGHDPSHPGWAYMTAAVSKLSLRPSEYFARNVWIGASFMGRGDVEAGVIELAGDRLMWANDYPHSEGTFPSTVDFISGTFFDRPVDETRRILGETAVDLYGFDLDALSATADRFGPTVERVALGTA